MIVDPSPKLDIEESDIIYASIGLASENQSNEVIYMA